MRDTGHITQWYYKFSTAVRTIDDQIRYLATVLGEWLVIRNRGDLRRKEEFCPSVDYLRLWLAKTSYLSSMPWAPSYSLEDETTGSTARTLFIVYRLICLFSQAWVVKIRTIILKWINKHRDWSSFVHKYSLDIHLSHITEFAYHILFRKRKLVWMLILRKLKIEYT